jgi:hypothetical protein
MSLEKCLRAEVTALLLVMDHAAPRIADHRPWYLKLASFLVRGVLL